MEREVAERFDRIETNLEIVTSSQVRTQEMLASMAESITRYVDAADTRMQFTEARVQTADERMARLDERIAAFIDAADTRMKRIEENLDGLIRAITAEHQNGQSQK